MKRFILLLVALFSFSFFGGAQSIDNYLDSLERIRVEEGAFSQEYMNAINEFCVVLEDAKMTNTYEYYASLYRLLLLTNYFGDNQRTLQIAPKLEPLIFVFSETPNEDAYMYERTMISASINTGHFEEGLYYCKEAFDLVPNSMDENSKHKEKADILALEANIYYMIQNKMEAKRCIDECKDALRYVQGHEQDIQIRIQLLDLEGLLSDEYDISKAKFDTALFLNTKLASELRASYPNSVEDNNFDPLINSYKLQKATILLHKGMIQHNNGEIKEAYENFLLSSTISEAIHDTISQIYIACQNNIAACLLSFGDVIGGINVLDLVKENIKKYYGEENELYATCLSNISIYYYQISNIEKAFQYALEAHHIYEMVRGRDCEYYGQSSSRLGALCLAEHKPLDAYRYLSEALSVLDYTGTNANVKCLLYSNLAWASSELDLDEFWEYFEIAEKMIDSVYGKQSIEHARFYLNFGLDLLNRENRHGVALNYIVDALDCLNYKGFTGSNLFVTAILWYGWACIMHDDYLVAEDFVQLATQSIEDYCGSFLSLTSNDRNLMWKNILNSKNTIMSAKSKTSTRLSLQFYFMVGELLKKTGVNDYKNYYLFNYYNYTSSDEMNNIWYMAVKSYTPSSWFVCKPADLCLYNYFLFSKSLMLTTSNNFKKAVFDTGKQEIIDLFNDIQNIQRVIDNQSFGLGLENSSIELLYEKKTSMERKLIAEMKALGYSVNNSVSYDDVRGSLQSDEIAVEFVDYYHIKDEKTFYVALLAKSSWENPVYIQLCTEDELKSCLGNPNVTYSTDDLYRLLWQPLAEYINEGDKVYFSPSGMLHTIALESLHTPDDSCLSDKYNLVRLTSTRELCKERQPKTCETGAVYGGLQYDVDQQRMTEVAAMNKTASDESPVFALRGEDRGNWNYLQGTKDEVEHIAGIMRQANIGCQLFEGDLGNEESFKALSGTNTDIIHLATHGYFLEGEKADMNDFMKSLSPLARQKTDSVIDPLLRSGLILSGGNSAWLGKEVPEGIEDGVLTALEISTMNLSGTDMVVMSACETGLGDITSDGVFGLQRAFKMAGVQTLVMSLWKVDDNATSLMMQTFYEHLLSGMSKREAFNLAQAAVRSKYPEPYYWAGFIMLD